MYVRWHLSVKMGIANVTDSSIFLIFYFSLPPSHLVCTIDFWVCHLLCHFLEQNIRVKIRSGVLMCRIWRTFRKLFDYYDWNLRWKDLSRILLVASLYQNLDTVMGNIYFNPMGITLIINGNGNSDCYYVILI